MQIAGYLPISLIEWPGKIAAVVFVPGCNFRCPFCHNRELVDPKHLQGAHSATLEVDEERVFADLERRKKWIDGVVMTGGEPTLQDDLSKFLSKCKQMGFETMIETNGSRPEAIASLLHCSIVDRIAIDIKTTLDKGYAKLVGRENFDTSSIVQSMRLIMRSGIPLEFRTTVVPRLHTKSKMVILAKQLKEEMQRCRDAEMQRLKWYLQTFQPKNCLDPEFNKIKPYSQKEMEEILAAVRKYILGAELR
jgi:pyruvate formate lyase activating enzyme